MILFEGEAYESCQEVLRILTKAGFDAYIVGGAVRDAILGLPVADFDLASSAKPEEVLTLFEKVVPTGIDHGTVTVIYQYQSFEITTFRSEMLYTDHRHPSEVSYVSTIEDDLSRRDFTINSMALSDTGDLIDPYGGQEDLKHRLIRTVGDPGDRFQEDALRMVRALRFQSVLDFTLEYETAEALSTHAQLLKYIAIERLQTEMSKLLGGKAAKKAFIQLFTSGVDKYLPGLSGMKDFLQKNDHLTMLLQTEEERWAWLTRGQSDPVSFLKGWRLSNRLVRKVEHLLHLVSQVQQEGWTKRTLYDAYPNEKYCERLLAVIEGRKPNYKQVDQMIASLEITSSDMLAVTGGDLINWTGVKPGPWVGEALRQIELAVLSEEIKNEKSSIKRWLEKWQTQ
ncbi:CCA tRNA nucleotidyltransferase [Pseudalkalibacillus hwajinpoensis]|uniref:CCA tRNA nucleotidyltransferase n=1 Tax=Guptibacillus hwajinpoensis TaxID=208199 RepID=UPI00325B6D66